ncbi:hypothetical protein M427DRAFT_464627 [Gonapodya prolifera JEL478]|uniref:Uncharacterized protein n=1 Tax=Gonapodya prolifera (strain JEL478) TaxID=1344416 RepID=A0A139A2Y5_GONPJ|nr:hypothetical protein M427DRAFT_464627 [Gonapodya prolifera JEL478]|eukprot:KXS10733.1 hypothetical protein M427DRAFT_464627 [Gonapodya prolifera JEL478]
MAMMEEMGPMSDPNYGGFQPLMPSAPFPPSNAAPLDDGGFQQVGPSFPRQVLNRAQERPRGAISARGRATVPHPGAAGRGAPRTSREADEKGASVRHVPCKFFHQGRCTAGRACAFSHEEPEATIICKYFVQGNCKYGANCALLHIIPVDGDIKRKNRRGDRSDLEANAVNRLISIGAGSSALSSSPPSPIPNMNHIQGQFATSPPRVPGGGFSRSEPVAVASRPPRHSDDPINGSPASLLPSSLSDLLTPLEQLQLRENSGHRTSTGHPDGPMRIPLPFSNGVVYPIARSPSASQLGPLDFPFRRGMAAAPRQAHSFAPGRIVDDPLRMYGRSLPEDGVVVSSPGSRGIPFVGLSHHAADARGSPRGSPVGSPYMRGAEIQRVSTPPSNSMLARVLVGAAAASGDDLFEMEMEREYQRERFDRAVGSPKREKTPPNFHRVPSNGILSNFSYSAAAGRGLPPSADPRRGLSDTFGNGSLPLCPFAAAGSCRYQNCQYLHGLPCPSCGKFVLHPHESAEAHQEHIDECTRKAMERDSDRRAVEESADVECGVCFESVALKRDPRFGLMFCDHAFCITCIRQWRQANAQDESKSCPLCRVFTPFVTPSSVWLMGDDKRRTIELYKSKLGAIPCRHFNYGDGQCPFGTSCFYAHRYRDGTKEEVKLRFVQGGDEEAARPMGQVKLADFLFPDAI